MDIVKFSKVEISGAHLIIPENMSKRRWLQLGSGIRTIEKSVDTWFNDWCNFGIRKGYAGRFEVGNIYTELELLTGLSRKTLQDRKYVETNVDSSRRCEDLTISHHREMASLPPEKQEEFLEKASREHLSRNQLRQQIKQYRQGITEEIPITPEELTPVQEVDTYALLTLQVCSTNRLKVMEFIGDQWREIDHVEI